MSALSLNTLRSRFSRLPTSAHKQMGLRALRDAAALEKSNPAYAAELLAKAAYHLPYAEAAR